MNKQELIDNIASSEDITKAAAARALDSVIDSVTNSLKKDDSVAVSYTHLTLPTNREV